MLKTVFKSALLLSVLFFITFGISILPFVPSLKIVKSLSSAVFVLASLAVVTFNFVKLFQGRKTRRYAIPVLVGGVFAGVLWICFSLFIFIGISLYPYLSGTDLIKTIPVETTGGTIYIYEKGSFPDGFKSTSIAYSSKFWLLEKNLYTCREVFKDVAVDKHFFEVGFIDGTVKRFDFDSLGNTKVFRKAPEDR